MVFFSRVHWRSLGGSVCGKAWAARTAHGTPPLPPSCWGPSSPSSGTTRKRLTPRLRRSRWLLKRRRRCCLLRHRHRLRRPHRPRSRNPLNCLNRLRLPNRWRHRQPGLHRNQRLSQQHPEIWRNPHRTRTPQRLWRLRCALHRLFPCHRPRQVTSRRSRTQL